MTNVKVLPNLEGFTSLSKVLLFISGVMLGGIITGGFKITDPLTLLLIIGIIAGSLMLR